MNQPVPPALGNLTGNASTKSETMGLALTSCFDILTKIKILRIGLRIEDLCSKGHIILYLLLFTALSGN